ncbi:MAG: hypothetical protein ACK4YP_08020, partial [Myxococcota bacterium]
MTACPSAEVSTAPALVVRHLGWSGLLLEIGGAALAVDAPDPVERPLVLTWTERERVAGARASTGPVAAASEVLAWLGLSGTPLGDAPVTLGGFTVAARPYRPIPYATAPEALRKTRSALRAPTRAAARLGFTLRRPASRPLALRVDRDGVRVVLLGQALHRFHTAAELAALAAWAGPADLVIAGTDYDDEVATGDQLRAFDARVRVVADLTGEIRRALRLPVRPLSVATAAAPRGT